MDRSGILVTGTTRVVFMIGTPVAQTRSPFLFNRHFADSGANRIMVPLDVSPAALPSFVAMVREAANCDGFVATRPHKQALLDLVDDASETARALESVNVVRREPDGRLVGDMADGAGFWSGVQEEGFDPRGKAVILAGAGAAATAIAYEFGRRGGRHLTLWSRDDGEMRVLGKRLSAWDVDIRSGMPVSLKDFDMAINATPLGMSHAPGSAFSPHLVATLPDHAIVADAITEPAMTELLRTASGRGLKPINGYTMTSGQMHYLLEGLGIAES